MTRVVVVGIVQHGEKVLLLKRTSARDTNANKWEFVSGYIKEFEPTEHAILREVKEETGLEGIVSKRGRPFEVNINNTRWIIIPHLVEVESDDVLIDWNEHIDAKWILPKNVAPIECVKGIEKDLKAVGLLKSYK